MCNVRASNLSESENSIYENKESGDDDMLLNATLSLFS